MKTETIQNRERGRTLWLLNQDGEIEQKKIGTKAVGREHVGHCGPSI